MQPELFAELYIAARAEERADLSTIKLLALTAYGVKRGSLLEITKKNPLVKDQVDRIIDAFGLYSEVKVRECGDTWIGEGDSQEYFSGPMWYIWLSQYPFRRRRATKNVWTEGEFYGYPFCCTKAYADNSCRSGPLGASLPHLDFCLCQPDCSRADALSKAYDAVLRNVLPREAYEILVARWVQSDGRQESAPQARSVQ